MSVSSGLFSRVLLTNDDGIDALGLRTLTEVAEELAGEVWIVAPDHDQSGTSQSLSRSQISDRKLIRGAQNED